MKIDLGEEITESEFFKPTEGHLFRLDKFEKNKYKGSRYFRVKLKICSKCKQVITK